MNVSRIDLAAAGVGDVAEDDDRLVAGRGKPDPDGDRVGRQLHPAFRVCRDGQLDRPGARAELWCETGRIDQSREDVGVGLARDVGEQRLGGRVGQADPAVGRAHDDALAHRPDDGVQLGGPGVLRLGEPLESDLDFDPLRDVACDGDDRLRAVVQGDRLEHDLDRDRRSARPLDLGHERRGVPPAGGDLVDEARQSRRVGRSDEVGDRAADQLVAPSPENVLTAAIDIDHLPSGRVEHDDGLDDGVEDRLGEAAVVARATHRHLGRHGGGGFGGPGPGLMIRHDVSMIGGSPV